MLVWVVSLPFNTYLALKIVLPNLFLDFIGSDLITKPFARCAFVWGDSISIPKNCSENEIEEFKNKLESEINICVDQAKKEINA